jgi:hypothetical protein
MKSLGSFIPPILSQAERDAISSPKTGELIYNSLSSQYNYYDGATWKNLVNAGGGTNPSDVGGGAASVPLSFSSGTIKHVETTSSTYASLAHFIYGGSSVIGPMVNINVNAWVTGNTTCDVRLYDLTNNLVVAELTGITSQLEPNLQSMGTLINIPAGPSVIEIQGRKLTGGGASKLRIGSLEIQYA